jgi:type VI secretion system protein ImpH
VPTVEERLFQEGFAFDFFQAVRVLEQLDPVRVPVGRGGPPSVEAVRFRSHVSLSFPPSAVFQVDHASAALPLPAMTVTFFGLTGANGALPRHYTELLLRIDREGKGAEKHAFRDWLDLFNHRLISLFYRAWEKYRFYVPYTRGEYAAPEPDPYTRCLYSLIGLGGAPLRNRLRVVLPVEEDGEVRGRVLAQVDDLALVYYSGFLAHRPRCATSLEVMLADYFQLPLRVQQFQGQWLKLDAENQTQVGFANGSVGLNVVAGERVWDVEGRIRIRLGPLSYTEFDSFIPDRTATPHHKAFYLLSHLVRLYVGPELDFDVQLVLKAPEVPECHLTGVGCPRLGWNTWIRTQALGHDADDAVFEGEELVLV